MDGVPGGRGGDRRKGFVWWALARGAGERSRRNVRTLTLSSAFSHPDQNRTTTEPRRRVRRGCAALARIHLDPSDILHRQAAEIRWLGALFADVRIVRQRSVDVRGDVAGKTR